MPGWEVAGRKAGARLGMMAIIRTASDSITAHKSTAKNGDRIGDTIALDRRIMTPAPANAS
jgi:hypothetical protein